MERVAATNPITPKVERVDNNLAVMNLADVAAALPKMERMDTNDVNNLEELGSFDTDLGIENDAELKDQSTDEEQDDHAMQQDDGIENNVGPPHESDDEDVPDDVINAEEDDEPWVIEQCEGCRKLDSSAACSFCTWANTDQ